MHCHNVRNMPRLDAVSMPSPWTSSSSKLQAVTCVVLAQIELDAVDGRLDGSVGEALLAETGQLIHDELGDLHRGTAEGQVRAAS